MQESCNEDDRAVYNVSPCVNSLLDLAYVLVNIDLHVFGLSVTGSIFYVTDCVIADGV
jgi:hypothetical protein